MSADINSILMHRDSRSRVVPSDVGFRLRLCISRRGPTLLGSRRGLRGLAVRVHFGHLKKGRSGQRVPSIIEIRGVVVGAEPLKHNAGQSVHFSVALLQQIVGAVSDAVKLRDLDLGIPADHRLKGSLSSGPTGRIEQDVDPTWDNPQKLPSLLGGGIRSLALSESSSVSDTAEELAACCSC